MPDPSAIVKWNTRSHASAYATAAPRAPDGTQARTAEACSKMFRIAGCRQPAIRAGAWRPFRCSIRTPLASEHHHAAHMRRLQPRPCLGTRGRATRMLQGGNQKFPCWMERNLLDACASSANARNKTPPGLATRGRSRASGDRGGRSPRESAVIRGPDTACLRRRAAGRTHPRRGKATGQTESRWREGGSWKSVR